jgi:sialic acid synthase SpsE
MLSKKVEILHCTSSYPASFENLNLSAMKTLKSAFNTKVGYSDHSLGIEIPIAAAALGADIIEKHFTLDKSMEGPDHKASIDCIELKNMVSSIRNVEQAIGKTIKHRLVVEREIVEIAHKRVIASANIAVGEKITLDKIIMKRANDGLFASNVWDLVGQIASKNYQGGDPI